MGVTWRSDRAPPDRRAATRRQPTLGTVCRLTAPNGDDLGTGLVWNLSARGISLLLERRLEPGLLVQAELLGTGGAAVARGLRVAHAAALRTGDFALGGQFDRDLSQEEMRPFLAV